MIQVVYRGWCEFFFNLIIWGNETIHHVIGRLIVKFSRKSTNTLSASKYLQSRSYSIPRICSTSIRPTGGERNGHVRIMFPLKHLERDPPWLETKISSVWDEEGGRERERAPFHRETGRPSSFQTGGSASNQPDCRAWNSLSWEERDTVRYRFWTLSELVCSSPFPSSVCLSLNGSVDEFLNCVVFLNFPNNIR